MEWKLVEGNVVWDGDWLTFDILVNDHNDEKYVVIYLMHGNEWRVEKHRNGDIEYVVEYANSLRDAIEEAWKDSEWKGVWNE